MKFLFIVQGEGRGHLTQAISLARMLRRNGHEVVGALVGKSKSRKLPAFFEKDMECEVRTFTSPNFSKAGKDGRARLAATALFNARQLPEYVRSIKFLKRCIEESGADRVVNFYEVLAGLTYWFYSPGVPQYSVGHQYVFLHKDFELPRCERLQIWMLRTLTRLTSIGAQERLALSFRKMDDDTGRHITVVPPLLRDAVLESKPTAGDYIHGYMLNPGFARSLEKWHAEHPETALRFFWDKQGEPACKRVDATLTYYTLDDELFVKQLAGCKAYACTAGFESVCEAMYLGKPVMMVPAHIEQKCNAYDAANNGAGIATDGFDVTRLLEFCREYEPNDEFGEWVRSAESRFLGILEKSVYYAPTGLLSGYGKLPKRIAKWKNLAEEYLSLHRYF